MEFCSAGLVWRSSDAWIAYVALSFQVLCFRASRDVSLLSILTIECTDGSTVDRSG